MPHLTAIEYSESQRRQLKAEIERLNKSGWPLSAKYDAVTFGTWEKLFENAVTPGLFAQRDAVIIENAETLGDFPENLSSMLEDENADTMIVIVLNGDSKILKSVSKQISIIKPEAQIPPWKRKDWLISLAKEQGFTISPDAAQLLAENVESQEELRGEITKLSIYADGRAITLEDAENLSFDEGGRALMNFLDGVCDCKPENVARSLNHLRDEPLLPTLTALTNRLRPAMMLAVFADMGDEALRAVDADPAKKKYAVTKARSALKNYGASRVKSFMMKASRLSFLEKTSHAEGWFGFEALIWELMTKI
ncbi:MAG: hypothetical protein IJM47_00610 [Synergistaceae bacterium]|nr:hypothetical protein [Synergistaceae bacterium]